MTGMCAKGKFAMCSKEPGVFFFLAIFSNLSDWCWSTDEITRDKHNRNQDQDCYRHLWVGQGISVRTGGLTRFQTNFCIDVISRVWLCCKNKFASAACQGCGDRRVLRQSSILFCTKPERNWSKIINFFAWGKLALVLFVCQIFVCFIYFWISCEFPRWNIHINQYLRTCKWSEINVSMPNMTFVYYNTCTYCVFNKM